MNSSKGVVRSRDLDGTDETEMAANLKSQGVTAVKRVQIRRDGKSILTNTYILTFNSPIAPKVIKAGFVQLAVSPFIPNPLRCFKCQRFGHHRDRCKRSDTCPRCGKEGHDGSDCSAEVKCVNCDGNHPAYAKVCPLWIREKEIQTVKVTNNITFFDAKKLVDSRVDAAVANKTYSSVAQASSRPSMKSVSVQTDLTWPKASSTYSRILEPAVASGSGIKATAASTQTSVSESRSTRNETPKAAARKAAPKVAAPKAAPKVAAPKAVPNTTKENGNTAKVTHTSDRVKKGSDDPIRTLNRFESLSDNDMDIDVSSRSRSKSPKKIIPVLPP